jgi:hypothetical protein
MNDDVELTPEEKQEFARLPREAAPSESLRERVFRALREDGTLRSAAGARDPAAGTPVADATSWGYRSPRRGLSHVPRGWGRPWVVATASMAASLLLFVSGVLMGQWLATQSTERALLAVREHDSAQLAQRVQEAGTAYISALVDLGELRATAGPGNGEGSAPSARQAAAHVQQGREAALGSLYGATVEMARLMPGDPDIARILQILKQRQFPGTRAAGMQETVWY